MAMAVGENAAEKFKLRAAIKKAMKVSTNFSTSNVHNFFDFFPPSSSSL
jgi:hypothetical protein